MTWDPDRYLKFRRERMAPFVDTLSLIDARPDMKVIDLGCGTGELTAKLHDALPGSEVLGVDSSAEMLSRAKPRDGLAFAQKKIEEVDGEWDLVFSHAAIHWVDDHERLIPRLFGLVKPGGQLVVQQPSNHDHDAMHIVASVAGFRRQVPVLPVARYAELLHQSGGRNLTVLEKVYCHELPDSEALYQWLSGTALLPYVERVPVESRESFATEVRRRLRERWPGEVFFAFRRIIFAATKA
jgi:trans-aconitate 2-methyltransferase